MTVFMLLAGTNFALLYRVLLRREPSVFYRDEEFRLYLGLLVHRHCRHLPLDLDRRHRQRRGGDPPCRLPDGLDDDDNRLRLDRLRALAGVALMALVGLMFIGGCAGSTSGSVKVARHLLMGKILRREVDLTLHPEIVSVIRSNRTLVNEKTLRAISAFVLLYIGVFIVGVAVLAIDASATGLDLSVIEAVAACATTLGNVGPGFGFAGPVGWLRAFRRCLHGHDGRPDVDGAAGADPGTRPLLAALLASLKEGAGLPVRTRRQLSGSHETPAN